MCKRAGRATSARQCDDIILCTGVLSRMAGVTLVLNRVFHPFDHRRAAAALSI